MRFSAQVDTLSLSDSSNKAGKSAEICHPSNVNGDTLSDSNDIVPNKQLQKFVEYVSYLKFLVTFVARDVNVRLDTKDEQDPITAASFEASGELSCNCVYNIIERPDPLLKYYSPADFIYFYKV